ncbi:MAG: RNA polymerase sigma-70 factor [Bacteroidales bacterium]|jgi:RNA polymerase sigma-70 factor (ECF subfamily)|nr:RNA polymerase sigma-70 factor [Bacteroidales bacterium]
MDNSIEMVWFELLRQGNAAGLRALFDRYYTALCMYVHTLTGNTALSEDVVQGIFIYLWENRRAIHLTTSVRAYLYGAAKNKALNSLRIAGRFTSLSPDMDTSVYEDLSVETEELYRLIEEAVQSLPEKCREIFRLSRDEELTYKKIAEIKNISPKTVETQIHLAIKRLRCYLSEKYEIKNKK